MFSLERARFVALGLLLVLAVAVWSLSPGSQSYCNCLQISFLNVGQGDAVYLRTPDEYELLVDGGRDAAVLRQLAAERSFFDRTIDVVVATHPDLDHIGGLIDVLARYQVDTILLSENQNDTSAATAFATAIQQEEATLIYADAGQRFQLGASTTITVFSPRGDESQWESNNASVVLQVTYGETDILLTGDASTGIEEYLVGAYGADLRSEILKLGHHGSRTSTSEVFLDVVQPNFAVVSAAVDNRYNHPHQDVMSRVFARNIQTFHTGTDGTVTFHSDGQVITKK